MNDAEYERLKAKFGPAQSGPDPDTVSGGMSDEAYEAAKAKYGAAAPPTAVAEPPKPIEATTTQNIRQGLGGPVQAAAEVADMGFHLSEGMDVVGDYIPDAVKAAALKVSPVTTAALQSFMFRNLNAGQPTERPGLKQAKEVLAPEFEGASRWAKGGRTFGEWAAAGPFSMGRKLLQDSMAALPKALREAAPDLAAGTGAAGGQAIGEYIDPETGGDVGELIGGLTGLVTGIKTGKLEGLSPA